MNLNGVQSIRAKLCEVNLLQAAFSVREYVFFVFFQISKKHDFLRFFEITLKKT